MRNRCMVAGAAVLLAAPLLAQQTGPDPTTAFRTGIELVTVDVGALDKNGQPVRGLTAADFAVTVAGETRRVVSAEYVDAAAGPLAITHGAEPGISTNESARGGRLFVFVVDQNTLEPGNARRVAAAASRFFARLTPADRSALMLIPVGPNVGFTWAHDRVRDALERVNGMASFQPTWEFGSLVEARDVASRNTMALRMIAERECGSSMVASMSGGGSTAPSSGGSGSSSGGGQDPGSGTGAGSGGGGGGGGTGSAPGGGTGGGGRGGGFGGGMMGGDRCVRDIQLQADTTWRSVQMTSLTSVTAMRQVLAALERVGGDKTVVLISGGWPLDDRDETTTMRIVATEAATARAKVFTIFVPSSTLSASRRTMSSTPTMDHHLQAWPLETLAGMTGGASFRAEVGAEAAFDRLGRELAGYYRIGVEKTPGDVDGQSRRMKVQITRSGVTVRAREIFDVRTYEDRDWSARLASALDAPMLATAVGLRMTTYLAADPEDSSQLRLVIAGEASRMQPGHASFRLAVRDLEGREVVSTDQPLGDAKDGTLPFSTNITVRPGAYVIRVAVMDSAGRVGSVDHRVEATPMMVGGLSVTGPLLVRLPGRQGGQPVVSLDTVQQGERLAVQVDVGGRSGAVDDLDVIFEVGATADGPAIVEAPADLTMGSRGTLLAQGLADVRLLPPGRYVARARILSGGEPLGQLERSFVLVAATAGAGADAEATTAAGAPASPLMAARSVVKIPPFAVDHVLAASVLGVFLDRVAARRDAGSPELKALVERVRRADPREVVVPDTLPADAPVAAFLRGLTLLARQDLEAAANAFRSAMRASSDFYPAMVYLGACYAAGGNDKEAAGAWRTALIKEGEVVAVHVLLADAMLRQRKPDLALQVLDAARARWPDDDEIMDRFGMAALLAERHADGLETTEALVERGAGDEPLLALALQVLYEAVSSGRPIQSVEQDRARMVRLADVYRARGGPSLALVEAWLEAARETP